MGLEISKHYSSYSFHAILGKLYEDIGYHRGIQAHTFLGISINLTESYNVLLSWAMRPRMYVQRLLVLLVLSYVDLFSYPPQ